MYTKLEELILKNTQALYERAADYSAGTIKPALFFSEIQATLTAVAKFAKEQP